MLDGGIIQRLLEEKWKTFARVTYLFPLYIIYLVSVSVIKNKSVVYFDGVCIHSCVILAYRSSEIGRS